MSAHATALLDASATLPVVRQFDAQMLRCVENEDLSSAQQDALLDWAHHHLISAYVAVFLDTFAEPAARSLAARSRLHPCGSAMEVIAEMLQGGLPLEAADLSFHCPPRGCERARALSDRLTAWVRRRTVLAAQRTRLHTNEELTRLKKIIEAHLLTAALARFGLLELLEEALPPLPALDATTGACLGALRATRGLAWTPDGAVIG